MSRKRKGYFDRYLEAEAEAALLVLKGVMTMPEGKAYAEMKAEGGKEEGK